MSEDLKKKKKPSNNESEISQTSMSLIFTKQSYWNLFF